ncbi:hypothetical protein Btru_019424 [Bulinus truncatus]|nr:hypothetical protein Btru_019424 [Bulinus truncatus]
MIDFGVVVADFGLAKIFKRHENFHLLSQSDKEKDTNSGKLSGKKKRFSRKKRQTVVGNPYWMAPEMMTKGEYDEKVDVFSYGIIVCETIARVTADPDYLPRSIDFGLNVEAFHKKFCQNVPEPYFMLGVLCSQIEPDQRPSFEKIHVLCEALDLHVEHGLAVPTELQGSTVELYRNLKESLYGKNYKDEDSCTQAISMRDVNENNIEDNTEDNCFTHGLTISQEDVVPGSSGSPEIQEETQQLLGDHNTLEEKITVPSDHLAINSVIVEDQANVSTIEDKGNLPTIEDKGNLPTIEDKGNLPTIEDKGNLPTIEDQAYFHCSCAAYSLSTVSPCPTQHFVTCTTNSSSVIACLTQDTQDLFSARNSYDIFNCTDPTIRGDTPTGSLSLKSKPMTPVSTDRSEPMTPVSTDRSEPMTPVSTDRSEPMTPVSKDRSSMQLEYGEQIISPSGSSPLPPDSNVTFTLSPSSPRPALKLLSQKYASPSYASPTYASPTYASPTYASPSVSFIYSGYETDVSNMDTIEERCEDFELNDYGASRKLDNQCSVALHVDSNFLLDVDNSVLLANSRSKSFETLIDLNNSRPNNQTDATKQNGLNGSLPFQLSPGHELGLSSSRRRLRRSLQDLRKCNL